MNHACDNHLFYRSGAQSPASLFNDDDDQVSTDDLDCCQEEDEESLPADDPLSDPEITK